MLKALIGLAVVAVIAFVGYFFWGEWQRAEAGARLAERRAQVSLCESYLDRRVKDLDMSKLVIDEVTRCLYAGLLDADEVTRRLAARR